MTYLYLLLSIISCTSTLSSSRKKFPRHLTRVSYSQGPSVEQAEFFVQQRSIYCHKYWSDNTETREIVFIAWDLNKDGKTEFLQEIKSGILYFDFNQDGHADDKFIFPIR